MKFMVGQKVKCIGKSSMAVQFLKIKLGETFTVVEVCDSPNGLMLSLSKDDGISRLMKSCIIPAKDFGPDNGQCNIPA